MFRVGGWICAVVIVMFQSGTRLNAQVPLEPFGLLPEVEAELYNQACGLFFPERLPEGSPYIPQTAICGSPVVAALARNWPNLSKSSRETFAFLFERLAMQRTMISPGGHFKIHYNVTGNDAVSPVDVDLNGISDYVDEVAATFESIYDLQIRQMGYKEPVPDSDGLYDIYIRELGQHRVYGLNYPVSLGNLTSTSYMHIDNNYTDSIYQTAGLDGLHVTAAHEFHHSQQFGYYAVDLTWYHELTATWMEDVAYDDVNDYFQYLPSFFNSPEISLDYQPSLQDSHQYGAAVYAHFLAAVYGEDIIRTTWENLHDKNPFVYRIEDMDEAMPAGGFAGSLPGFVIWNYFTGSRVLPGTYPEGANYTTTDVTTVIPAAGIITTGSGSINHLASEYMQVATSGQSGALRGNFTLEQDATWKFLTILVKDGQVDILRPTEAKLDIPDAGGFDEVVFVPISTELSGSKFNFDYSISLTAAPDGQTVPLGLQANGSGAPIVIFPAEVSQATIQATKLATSQPVSWSVIKTSGNAGISVDGVATLDAFQTNGNSFQLTATGMERSTVEITGTTGGTTRSVIWVVFTRPDRINTLPVFTSISDQVVLEGGTLSFAVEALDADGDEVVLGVQSLPDGATFSDGLFKWTPGFDQAGTYEIKFSADDGTGQVLKTVRIQVQQTDQPVMIQAFSPSRALVLGAVGQTMQFSVTAVDPDQDPVAHSWTVDGVPQAATEGVLSLLIPDGVADVVVLVRVTGNFGVELTQRWTVGRALRGDFNIDGSVTFADFVLLASVFNTRPGDAKFSEIYDLNSNQVVDFADFVIFVSYFGLP